MESRASLTVFIALLAGLDVVALATARQLPQRPVAATPDEPGLAEPTTPPSASAVPQVSGWALCQTKFDGAPVQPASVAITYLDREVDLHILPNEIRAWFGDLDPDLVDVYKLQTTSGTRRIAFEIQRGKWPRWSELTRDLDGQAICGAIRAALLDAGVGRPRPADVIGAPADADDDTATAVAAQRSRYDFEFIYARRRQLYRQIEWVGPLEHALELDNFVELRQWLHSGR